MLFTAVQFMFIALTCLPYMFKVTFDVGCQNLHFHPPCAQENAFLKPKVPHWAHLGMALLSGGMSFLNNIVFAYNISQPTHIVFRTSGLLISCVVGALFFGRSYSVQQTIAVIGVAVGSSLCTIAEAAFGDTAAEANAVAAAQHGAACCGEQLTAAAASLASGNLTGTVEQGRLMLHALVTNEYTATWAVGIGLMMITVIMASFLGQLQKLTADKLGRAPTESIFYSHITPLIAVWVGMGSELFEKLQVWGQSPPAAQALSRFTLWGGVFDATTVWATLPDIVGQIPVLYLILGVNVLSQWMCIQGVFNLTAYADPLTANVVMTVRKFVSLLFSVLLFGNTFTGYHWAAAVLVFASVTLYSWSPPSATPKTNPQKAKLE